MGIRNITPEQLADWEPASYLTIDVRDQSAYELGNIPGSLRIARQDLLDGNFDLPKDKKLVFYCMFGVLSKDVADKLDDEGYQAYHLEGGYGD